MRSYCILIECDLGDVGALDKRFISWQSEKIMLLK